MANNRAREDFTGPANTRTWPMDWNLAWPQQWLYENFSAEGTPGLYLTTTPSGRMNQHQNVHAYIDDWAAANVRVSADIEANTTTVFNRAGLLARFMPDDPDTLTKMKPWQDL